jgi:hypothetical protein
MTEKLTACKDCEYLKKSETFRWVAAENVCRKNPHYIFDYMVGKTVKQGHKLCSTINTDGHCKDFSPSERE